MVTFDRQDLVQNYEDAHLAAVHETVNIIMLGSQCQVSLESIFGSSARGRETVSLLSIDPYPHHVATALEFVSGYLEHAARVGLVGPEVLKQIRRLAMTALDQVPQCSASLQITKSNVYARLETDVEGSDLIGASIGGNSNPYGSGPGPPESWLHGRNTSQPCGEATPTSERLNILTPITESGGDGGIRTVSSTPMGESTSESLSAQRLFDPWDWTALHETSALDLDLTSNEMFLSDHGLLEVRYVMSIFSPLSACVILSVDGRKIAEATRNF